MSKVIITGIAGGIGSATAKFFKRNGWYVIGIDRKSKNMDGVDMFLRYDVSKRVLPILPNGMTIDTIINNAAIQPCKSILDISFKEWNETLNSNLRSIVLTTQTYIPNMVDGGSIVNVSSIHALATSKGVSAYVASKGGILALTRAMALDLADKNIKVNALLPGATNTHMLHSHLNEEGLKKLKKRTPLGRIGKPEEIAHAIYFLAISKFITGQSLVVDGGATARLSTE